MKYLNQNLSGNSMTAVLLHLSDIHIKTSNDPILKRSESIASCVFSSLPLASHLFIIVSGDVAFSGEENQYVLASNFMWCCTMALNGLIQKGVPTDWATHMIGHELTAKYDIDHAMTLAIIFPNLWRYKFENKKEKLAQYAERIWDIRTGSIEEKAEFAIQKTLDFLHGLEVKTKLSDYTENYNGFSDEVKKTFEARNWIALGERKDITPDDVKKIVERSY